MRKIIYLTAAMATIGAAAHAAQTCVKLDITGKTSCSATVDSATQSGKSNWSAECENVEARSNVAVRGISQCGASVSGTFTSADEVPKSTDSSDPCWCKMTYPFESQWVMMNDSTGIGSSVRCDTWGGCAWQCSYAIANHAEFRKALFSNQRVR